MYPFILVSHPRAQTTNKVCSRNCYCWGDNRWKERHLTVICLVCSIWWFFWNVDAPECIPECSFEYALCDDPSAPLVVPVFSFCCFFPLAGSKAEGSSGWLSHTWGWCFKSSSPARYCPPPLSWIDLVWPGGQLFCSCFWSLTHPHTHACIHYWQLTSTFLWFTKLWE